MCRRFAPRDICLVLVLALAACAKDPVVGGQAAKPSTTAVPDTQIALIAAEVAADNHVVVTFKATQDGLDVPLATFTAIAPRWTLAGLSTEQVSGLPAWKSYLLNGAPLVSLPVAGPGTPAEQVLPNASQPTVNQPGYEAGGTFAELGDGTFTYTFAIALPADLVRSETLRVGVFLSGTPGTPKTCATLDFAPDGGPVQSRELVVDASCNGCHGTIKAHGGFRQGTRLCLTCHTWQHADPNTVDPAALAGATPATNPNPLELGRLVHRIHRGRRLPTLYLSTSTAPAPTLPSATAPQPLPFSPLSSSPPRNAPLLGQKFSVLGDQGFERVFGVVESRSENGQPAKTLASGVFFPRDYRDCNACHGNAAQAPLIHTESSRRSCNGCHPDVWFGDGAPDTVHLAHPGGVQHDDSQCVTCHVGDGTTPARYVAIKDAHVPPYQHPRYNLPRVDIVAVQNLAPGMNPTVIFNVTDRDGQVSPLNTTSTEAPGTASSPVPRGPISVSLTISGPTSPDVQTRNFVSSSTAPVRESVPPTTAADPSTGLFRYTFMAQLPPDATGTWAVAAQASRSFKVPHYLPCDTSVTPTCPGTDVFPWPYTNESVSENAENAVKYVDTAVGRTSSGSPVPRRQVVEVARCNRCHGRLSAHTARHDPAMCVLCHAPDQTDFGHRPKDANGNVNLGATFDGLEERSVDFKTFIHRIHTGNRRGGSARLELSRPHVVSGSKLLDDVEFPGDLANCLFCHLEGTYSPDAIQADAAPTVANETPTILHQGTAAHVAGERARPPTTAACMGCHDTATALVHSSRYTVSGVEQCAQCHVKGAVKTVHGLK